VPYASGVNTAPLLLVSVNNSRTRVGLARAGELAATRSMNNADADAMAREARSVMTEADEAPAAILLSSVNDGVADPLSLALREVFPRAGLYRVGRDLPIPMPMAVDEPTKVGADRLLAALAAWRRVQHACIVVDVGTAVTVDFIDGEGTYQGGAIAPGLSMMLDAMHQRTEKLPAIPFEMPDPAVDPFGKTTASGMRLGVVAAVRGLVRDRVEAYAELYGAFPQVVATGGDMGVLEHDGVIEHFVPDLVLLGMLVCAEEAVSDDEADEL
jgi:type III pantothenate kinase